MIAPQQFAKYFLNILLNYEELIFLVNGVLSKKCLRKIHYEKIGCKKAQLQMLEEFGQDYISLSSLKLLLFDKVMIVPHHFARYFLNK